MRGVGAVFHDKWIVLTGSSLQTFVILTQLAWKNWFGTKGFSPMPKQFVLLTETPPQPNLLFPAGAALKCTPSSSISLPLLSSSSPFAPPPFWVCATSSALSAPPISSALWAASSLRQTAPFMKSVTWAGLHRPGDYAALPLTAQVLQELEECLSSSILCLLPHSCSFIIIFFLSSESRLSVRSSSRPAFSPLHTSLP